MGVASGRGGLRQLLIGVDAMEWDLVLRWAREGKLPTFRRMMDQGMLGELSTTAAQLPDTVWTSLHTGLNPAKLEKYFYVQYDAMTMGLRHVLDDAIQQTPFWEYLSKAGCRVGIVDVPEFPLSRSLNGFQLTNWGAHASTAARSSTPASLWEEIESRFGRHPVGECDAVYDAQATLRRLRDRVLEGVRSHGEVFRYLMRERPWDVFFASFSASHCIGHHFWHFMDSTHPRQPKVDKYGLKDAIEQAYRAIDREVGEMRALAGGEIRCMVVAGHGMGALYHASWNLPEILELLGYGRRPVSEVVAGGKPRTARVNPWRILKMTVPGALQYRIKAMLPQAMQDHLLILWHAGRREWEGCPAFAIPNNDSVGAIRVSVKGRDLRGYVEPGDEYRRVCRGIANALYELTDPASGQPVVKRVTLTHEEFQGPFLDQLPDLTVLWDHSFPWGSLHSPRFGTLRLHRQDGRTGSHTPHGFVLVTGPGVPACAKWEGRSIYDIAPTVMNAAGVPIPPDLDGRPLPIPSVAAPL